MMATTLVDGITLAYVDEGSGDPVVLLHGWGGQAASMMPLIVGLRDRYRVLAFDLPGFGGSSPPPVPWVRPNMLPSLRERWRLWGSRVRRTSDTRLVAVSPYGWRRMCLKLSRPSSLSMPPASDRVQRLDGVRDSSSTRSPRQSCVFRFLGRRVPRCKSALPCGSEVPTTGR